MQTTAKPSDRKFDAPTTGPNDFHIHTTEDGQEVLHAGLGKTPYPVREKPVSPEEIANLAERELALADAENRIEGLKAAALVEIEQGRKALEAERADFEREKAAAAKKAK
jgi:hypothetical protein